MDLQFAFAFEFGTQLKLAVVPKSMAVANGRASAKLILKSCEVYLWTGPGGYQEQVPHGSLKLSLHVLDFRHDSRSLRLLSDLCVCFLFCQSLVVSY